MRTITTTDRVTGIETIRRYDKRGQLLGAKWYDADGYLINQSITIKADEATVDQTANHQL